MSSKRKAVRDWFKQALLPHAKQLGATYPVRAIEFDEGKEPERFTNVYISEGEIQSAGQGLGFLTHMTCEVGFHLKAGKDDDLDHMQFIADRALSEYCKQSPPPFDFYETRFNYSGDTEDAYVQLFVSFQIISR